MDKQRSIFVECRLLFPSGVRRDRPFLDPAPPADDSSLCRDSGFPEPQCYDRPWWRGGGGRAGGRAESYPAVFGLHPDSRWLGHPLHFHLVALTTLTSSHPHTLTEPGAGYNWMTPSMQSQDASVVMATASSEPQSSALLFARPSRPLRPVGADFGKGYLRPDAAAHSGTPMSRGVALGSMALVIHA